LENSLFIFSSDNGAEVPDKVATGPLRSHKASLYEGGHRVPLVAAWPLGGIGDGDPTTAGATYSGLLGLNDLYATSAEILQVPLPPPTGPHRGAEDSFSLLAALRGEKAPERPPLFPNDHQEASQQLSDERAWVAVRSNAAPIPGQWKLLLDHRYAFHGEIHPQELYDLAEDLQETHNRIDDPAAKPALDFLVQQAREAAGDDGFTRKPLASSKDR
jgi:arylsulfatase A-like enzyme